MASIKLKLVSPTTMEEAIEGDLGVFIDGILEETYNIHSIPENYRLIENMLSCTFENGKRERSKEISKILCIK